MSAISSLKKLVHCYLELEENGSQLRRDLKYWFTVIQRPKYLSYSYLEPEHSGSQLFGAYENPDDP